MFHLSEYRKKPDRLTDLLPWVALVDKGVLLNKDGSLQKTYMFRGPDLESSTEQQLVSITARLNNTLKRLGSGWALYIEARRKKAMSYPESNFENIIASLIDLERKSLFETENENYESYYYLTFQFLPPGETTSKLSNIFVKKDKKESKNKNLIYKNIKDQFLTTVNQLYDIMLDFMYDIRPLNDEESLTYLHDCISDKSHTVKIPDVPCYLDALLADTPLVGGLEPKLGKNYLKTISILGFPTTSVPAILDQLNHLPIEYRWVTRFLPLDKTDAENALKSYRRQWFSKRKSGLTLLKEMISKGESAMVDSSAVQKITRC